jgi:hypothetical protein
MAKYVIAYHGGGMGQTSEEQQEIMTRWMAWFGGMGGAVVDAGSPFGESATIEGDGSVSDSGSSSLTGYSIVTAESLADAIDKAKGCPVLTTGGSLEVYETVPIG